MEKRTLFHNRLLPWLLLLPQLAVISIFFFWPAAQAFIQSVQEEDPFGLRTQFVGMKNFIQLWNNEFYLQSFQTTAIFSVLVAFFGISIALMFATFADRITRGSGIYKTLMILPYAIAPVLAGVLWGFMFSPGIGIVSWVLRKWGIEWNHLINSHQAMALVVMAAIWKQISYNFLFFLAGLQSIPKSLIEAAAIDGAGPWRRFWNIQFPLLSPTSGGPGQSTNTLVYKVYQDGFKNLDLGGSAAQSVVLMLIVVVLTILQFRYVEKKVQY